MRFCMTTLCIFMLVILLWNSANAGFSQSLNVSETCMIAKLAYWAEYTDVRDALLDPVWHFKNSPVSEGRVWPKGMCNQTSIYPTDPICECPDSVNWFLAKYDWFQVSRAEAFDYWVSHQNYEDGGIVWHGEYCYNGTTTNNNATTERYTLPYECTCLAAMWDYLARYTDVAKSNIDPIYHFENSGKKENRLWDCALCTKNSIYPNNSICNCTAAARNFTNMYPWHTGLTLGNAYGEWLASRDVSQEYWPCDLCIISDIQILGFSGGLARGLAAIVGLGLLLGIFAVVMLGVYWSAFHTHGSFYSSVIISGVMLGYVAAIMLLPDPTDNLCLVFPWLLGTSFVLVYGCLFIKTWVLYRVWRKALNYKRSSITASYIIKCIAIALAVEFAFLVIWTVMDPPTVRLVHMVDGSYQRQCNSDSIIFWAVFIGVKGVWLAFGVVLSIATRNVAKEYNESNCIAYAIYNDIGLAMIAIPLSFVLANVPGGSLVVEVAAISLSFSFTLCILFFNVWYSIFFPEKDVLGERLKTLAMRGSTISTSTSTTASTTASTSTFTSTSPAVRTSVGVVVSP